MGGSVLSGVGFLQARLCPCGWWDAGAVSILHLCPLLTPGTSADPSPVQGRLKVGVTLGGSGRAGACGGSPGRGR